MSFGGKRNAAAAYTAHNKVELIRGGQAYFERMVSMIRSARSTIHLQTYIYDEDETGLEIAAELMDAAHRGVKVFLLLDGYASQHLSGHFLERLKKSGIHFRWFSPLFHSRHFYFGRRMHHKVIVADGSCCMVGGINISNRYNDMGAQAAWLDWAAYNEGEASEEVFYRCSDLWNKAGWGSQSMEVFDEDVQVTRQHPFSPVRMRVNDWVNRKNQITRSYLEMFKKAGSHIYIMSSYFLPGIIFRKNILAAAKRGVQIKVILAGKSDVLIAKQAERYVYRWLLRKRITLFEYQPTVLHGKLSCYDRKWTTVGSYNVNNISAYASIEMNLDVLDESFTAAAENLLEEIIRRDCVRVTPEEYRLHNTFLKRLWQKTCYEIIRIIFSLFTFYFRQRV